MAQTQACCNFLGKKTARCVSKFVFVIHRGEKVDKAIRQSGVSLKQVASRMGHSRRTLYRRLEEPNLAYDYIIELYKIIKRDPLEDFPELSRYIKSADVEEYNIKPSSELSQCKEELDYWKNEAYIYMKKYNSLLEESRKTEDQKRV